jgi:hypothetical protein
MNITVHPFVVSNRIWATTCDNYLSPMTAPANACTKPRRTDCSVNVVYRDNSMPEGVNASGCLFSEDARNRSLPQSPFFPNIHFLFCRANSD